ncbi:MAG TPA: hypothetical protein VHN14_00640 [Kofleriaceae bacterium]|nr:hypothetical protein [Kofleriaceae bacterium]
MGTLVMDWYQLSPDDVVGGARAIAIDLRTVHLCGPDQVCETVLLTPFSGVFPTLAMVTLWSSLGFAALVLFQASTRVLTGNANNALTKLGYLLALLTISLTVTTAYMFGLEPEGIGSGLTAQVGSTLHRTWAPLILLVGHVAGFATVYMAVASEPNDVGAAYKPATPVPARRVARGHAAALSLPRPSSPAGPAGPAGPGRHAAPASFANIDPRTPSGVISPSVRIKTGPIPPVPEHLRNRLSYVAITAELTAGGIDARREDGSSRLVLWRDVVGVVARRMPPAYDNATFVDIVSTAGSTLRIMPWTRLTGDPIVAQGDTRARHVVERVVAMCPAARLDPATRVFLQAGEAAQLPDRETLQAHDDRLA